MIAMTRALSRKEEAGDSTAQETMFLVATIVSVLVIALPDASALLDIRKCRIKHLNDEVSIRLIDAHGRREADCLTPKPALAKQ